MTDFLLASSGWQTAGSIIIAILILLAMITIHEFGHWIAGTVLKFKIDEFSIGFGPALFKRKNKKNDQIFALRLIPLGGYCAFHGEDGTEEQPDPFLDAEKEPALSEGQEPLSRTEEESAPEAGRQEPAETAQEERNGADGQEAEKAEEGAQSAVSKGKKRKRRVPEWKQKEDDGSFTRKAPWKRIIVLVAGALMNYILALVCIVICFFAYGQQMTAVWKAAEAPEGIAAENCIQDLDVFLKADGKNLYLPADLARAVNGKKAGDKVKLSISRAFGVVWETDENGKEKPKYEHREKMTVEIVLRSDVKVKNSSDLNSAWEALGILYEKEEDAEGNVTGGEYALCYATAKFGFFETLGRSFVYSFKIAGSIFRVLGELLTGRIGIRSFGGPVSTIKVASQAISGGFRYFLEISALIGVNLAVFNLLPIPALDGSKIVFTIIEWVRGKPISRKVEAVIHAAGFVFLLGFAILVDILQFV